MDSQNINASCKLTFNPAKPQLECHNPFRCMSCTSVVCLAFHIFKMFQELINTLDKNYYLCASTKN